MVALWERQHSGGREMEMQHQYFRQYSFVADIQTYAVTAATLTTTAAATATTTITTFITTTTTTTNNNNNNEGYAVA
jgi:hypothetical protein